MRHHHHVHAKCPFCHTHTIIYCNVYICQVQVLGVDDVEDRPYIYGYMTVGTELFIQGTGLAILHKHITNNVYLNRIAKTKIPKKGEYL